MEAVVLRALQKVCGRSGLKHVL